jgi:hypothetical protein
VSKVLRLLTSLAQPGLTSEDPCSPLGADATVRESLQLEDVARVNSPWARNARPKGQVRH